MTFIWLNMLWLLLAVPLLLAVYAFSLYRKKKAAARFANLTLANQTMAAGFRIRRHIPPALLLVSLTLLIVAMARPATVLTLASQRGTIIMAIDVSGSMRAADVKPNRITAAQTAAKAFINERPRTIRIGIVAFSGGAFLVQPPTTNTDDLDAAIDNLSPERMTAVGAAVLTSLQTIFPNVRFDEMVPGYGTDQFTSGASLDTPPNAAAQTKTQPTTVAPGSNRSAAIILMTDGRNTTGPDPVEAARIAANLGVRVFTIGFGTANGEMVGFYGRSIRAVLDEDTLKQMATLTHAQYFHAQSATELEKIYSTLNTQLQKEVQLVEISSFFVLAAGIFAALSAFLSVLWFNRIF